MSLVHDGVVDGPGVGEVPLLEAKVVVVSEAWNVAAGRLKRIVGIELTTVVEVVVSCETLVIVDPVIETSGELIGVVASHWNNLILAAPDIGRGHKLLQ